MTSVVPRTEPEDSATLDTSGPLHARTTIPEAPAGFVGRPRVEHLLDDAVSRRLTLVSAGPGWGKTTAVAAWARAQHDALVAWLTLEPADAEPTAFWADVLTTLRRADAVPMGHPLNVITVPSRISSDLVRRLLYAIDLLPRPVTLVLDDFHHVGREVLEAVDDLLRYPLPLHLVVLTRVDPLLSLQRLRIQGQVAEVGAGDLEFRAEDIGSLGAAHGHTFEAEQIARLVADTGGWAAGVRLHVEAYDDPVERGRAQRSAAEYLLAEVLERLDATARRFLLRTSVTSSVCAELAATLDPGAPAARLLPELAATNGFVVRFDADGSWFQYHPLLREMLRSELMLEDPDAGRDAHRAAARWFARHGEPLLALEHAVESADWPLVGDVFVDVASPQLAGPRRQAVVAALRRVPFASISPTVPLRLCAASVSLVATRYDAAFDQVGEARGHLGYPSDEPASSVVLGLIEASAAGAVGDVQRQARAGKAALAAAGQVPYPFPALDIYRTFADAHEQVGEAWCTAPQDVPDPPAGPSGGRIPPFVMDVGDADLVAACELVELGARSAQALLEIVAGHLQTGEPAARAVVDEASTRGWVGHVQTRAALAGLAWAGLLRAEDERAGLLLAQARSATSGGRESASEAATRLVESLLATVHGRAHAAQVALAGAEGTMGTHPIPPMLADLYARAVTEVALLDGGTDDAWSTRPAALQACDPDVATVCVARVLLRRGRTAAALRTVEQLADVPDGALDDLTRVEATLVEASALVRTGTRYADHVVERGLHAAEPELLVRPFLTVATDELLPLIRRLVTGRTGALAERLRALLVHPDTGSPAPLVEPLTERERAILAMLPSMASNLEIAEELFVSVNTVKAHLKTLYRKLDVGSRRDAVRRGRQLDLIT